MAFYKQHCNQCGQLIDANSRHCTKCGSHCPFGYFCPTCLHQIKKGDTVCRGCGRRLYIVCPSCNMLTFVQDDCERCEKSLMILCPNTRCGQMQFFQNEKCTACRKKLRK